MADHKSPRSHSDMYSNLGQNADLHPYIFMYICDIALYRSFEKSDGPGYEAIMCCVEITVYFVPGFKWIALFEASIAAMCLKYMTELSLVSTRDSPHMSMWKRLYTSTCIICYLGNI